MGKQRRGRGQEQGSESASEQDGPGQADRDVDVAASEVLGNAAFQSGMDTHVGWGEGEGDLLATLAGADLGGAMGIRVATGLREAPRDAAEQARLVAILGASNLARADELTQRLEQQQARALAVEAAVLEHLGPLSEAERSSLAAGYASAQGEDQDEVAAEVAESPGVAAGVASLAALTAAILARVGDLEEEEEEPLGMDYATEESGM